VKKRDQCWESLSAYDAKKGKAIDFRIKMKGKTQTDASVNRIRRGNLAEETLMRIINGKNKVKGATPSSYERTAADGKKRRVKLCDASL